MSSALVALYARMPAHAVDRSLHVVEFAGHSVFINILQSGTAASLRFCVDRCLHVVGFAGHFVSVDILQSGMAASLRFCDGEQKSRKRHPSLLY